MKEFNTIFIKELLSFFRTYGLVLLIIYSFTSDVYVAAKGIVVTPQNVTVGYVDFSDSKLPKTILAHLRKPEFKKPIRFKSEEELKKAIFDKKIMVGIIFNSDFTKNLYKNRDTQINILADATVASQSQITSFYIQNIVSRLKSVDIPLNIKSVILFNPNTNSKWFMSLSELMSVLTVFTMILTAISFVKEKEEGTWDIMLLMPIPSYKIILAKVLSQVVVVMLALIISLGFVVFLAFDTPINGSFLSFILLTFLFVFSIAGLGLFVASVSSTIMQVAQLSIIIMMPMIFLSGSWSPIYSMSPFLQYLSFLSPLRYYIEGTESIFFRGSEFVDLLPYFGAEVVLSLLLFWYGYRKIGKLF